MYSSCIGEIRRLILSTLSGMMSTASTWLCCASKVAIDSPTYPVPATAMVMFVVLLLGIAKVRNFCGKTKEGVG